MKNILSIYIVFIALISASLSTIYFFDEPLLSTTVLSFLTVILSALLISWAAEAGQFVVSQGLAVAAVALLQVLPEFMVEGVIAWKREVELIFANLTGSNRLLMGVGWSGIFFISYLASDRGKSLFQYSIKLRREYVIENIALIVSSLYFILIMIKKTLTLLDALPLAIIFIAYMTILQKLPPEGEEEKDGLLPYPAYIVSLSSKRKRSYFLIFLFLFGGTAIILVADPFLESLKECSALLGVSAFFFIQWIAPFLSEFPEKVTAFYWASNVKTASMGLLNMISSKVNQWTLLVTMIPIVYCISSKGIETIPIVDEQVEEIFLSFAMTIFGVSTLLKKSFNFVNALFMFSLWFIQFIYPHTIPLLHIPSRLSIGILFLVLAFFEVAINWKRITIVEDLKYCLSLMEEKRGLRIKA